MATVTGFNGIDNRQTALAGTALVFRVFLQAAGGAVVTSGTIRLRIMQTLSDGSWQQLEFSGTPVFKSSSFTTSYVAMSHQALPDGGNFSGYWTVAFNSASSPTFAQVAAALTVGGLYTAMVSDDSGAAGVIPPQQAREFIWGSAQGDLTVTSAGNLQVDLQTFKGTAQTANGVDLGLVLYVPSNVSPGGGNGLPLNNDSGNCPVDLQTIKAQTVVCNATVTVSAYVGESAQDTAQTGDAYARLNTLIAHAFTYDANNLPKVDVVDILGTQSPATAGYIGPDWSNVHAPTTTVGLTGTTIATVTTATTATNLTNAPTAGDFTATMKTSLNAATPASVTGAVGSVTGNVGGNVTGSVGSVVALVTANATQFAGKTLHVGSISVTIGSTVGLIDTAAAYGCPWGVMATGGNGDLPQVLAPFVLDAGDSAMEFQSADSNVVLAVSGGNWQISDDTTSRTWVGPTTGNGPAGTYTLAANPNVTVAAIPFPVDSAIQADAAAAITAASLATASGQSLQATLANQTSQGTGTLATSTQAIAILTQATTAATQSTTGATNTTNLPGMIQSASGGGYQYTVKALAEAPSGGGNTIVNVLPGNVSVSGGVSTTAIEPAWQHSFYQTTFSVVDGNGNPINLSGVDLTMDFWDPNVTPLVNAIQAATSVTTLATLSVGGTNSNMVTLTITVAANITAIKYNWLLRPTANNSDPYTSGTLTIHPATTV